MFKYVESQAGVWATPQHSPGPRAEEQADRVALLLAIAAIFSDVQGVRVGERTEIWAEGRERGNPTVRD